MSEEDFNKYTTRLRSPVTVTPQQVADVIHGMRHPGQRHQTIHSCSCAHLAMFYLGVTKEHGLYWPDGKGGNAWDTQKDEEWTEYDRKWFKTHVALAGFDVAPCSEHAMTFEPSCRECHESIEAFRRRKDQQ